MLSVHRITNHRHGLAGLQAGIYIYIYIYVTPGGARDWTETLYLLYQTLVCPRLITVSTYHI